MEKKSINKHKKYLLLLGIFFIGWVSLTIWLNLKHKKEIAIISKSNDLALKVTHTSDVLISSFVTDYPDIHSASFKKYSDQLKELSLMKEELKLLWPNTPEVLVKSIQETEVAFKDLSSNEASFTLHERFSSANVYFKNVAYHEYSVSRKNMLHKNLPLFLILALIIYLGFRALEKSEFTWFPTKDFASKMYS